MVDGPTGERIAVVTGVDNRAGIGFAVARRLLDDGAKVLVHSFSGTDDGRPEDADGVETLLSGWPGAPGRLRHVEADLGDPDAPPRVIAAALEAFGAVDALVVNHAHGSDRSPETPSRSSTGHGR
jgi:3-oxoacyl-[acyl-carrier protein] reductase